MDTPQKLYYTESKTGRIRIEDKFGTPHTILDEVDNKYGRLLVLKFVGMTNGHAAVFLCLCDPTLGGCGKRVEMIGSELRSKNSVSCGCYSHELTAARNHERSGVLHDRFRDLTGVKQADGGRLTALRVHDFDENFRHARWLCQCACGKTVVVRRGEFLSGGTKSCGCWKQDVERARWAGALNPKFNDGRRMGNAKSNRADTRIAWG